MHKKRAKQTFLAFKNPYHSVKAVFPNAIDSNAKYYLGVKDTSRISQKMIDDLASIGFVKHTVDVMSHNGRAIDLQLKNPITNRFMTGSSSGTAINVFLGINDIGLGTDGGGSVLAPAIALNLFSVISPYFSKNDSNKAAAKQSTDGISFSPSYGFIANDVSILNDVICQLLPTIDIENYTIVTDDTEVTQHFSQIAKVMPFEWKYTDTREQLINKCVQLLETYDVIISKEGKIDVDGIGDTIFGHFDDATKLEQVKANKGFLRVVNMCGFSAISIPTAEFATGLVCIVKTNARGFSILKQLLEQIPYKNDPLIERYFRDANAYFESGMQL